MQLFFCSFNRHIAARQWRIKKPLQIKEGITAGLAKKYYFCLDF